MGTIKLKGMDRLSLLAGLGATLLLGAWPAQAGPRGQVAVAIINGGYKAPKNYESHLVHLEEMRDALRARGLSDDQIVAFISDGGAPGKDMVSRAAAEPTAWMLEGTDAQKLLPRVRTVDTPWDGPQQPATRAAISGWMADADLRRGDTLMLYVTDHGYRDKEAEPPRSGLWLWEEKLTPDELGAWVADLDTGVRTVVVMSQCYSGAFADLAWADGPPDGSYCGFFSVPADRPAYGCYPDGRTRSIGHGFRFMDAMPAAESLQDAHDWVNLADRTPDVPLATSDLYLAHLLSASAGALDDGLAQWLPAVTDWSTVDAIAGAFGLPPARSVADLRDARAAVKGLERRFGDTDERWAGMRKRAAADRLDVLLDELPRWAKRLESVSGQGARDDLRAALLGELEAEARARGDWAPFLALRAQDEAAEALIWRLKTRRAAIDRMEAAMVRLAGEAMLAAASRRDRSARALRSLRACEATAVGQPTGVLPPLPEPYPDLDAEAVLVESLIPSLLGIRFEPVSPREARRLDVPGAVRVKSVAPDSPADVAGIQAEDVLTGLDGVVFQTPFAIQTHIALAQRSAPVQVAGLRGEAAVRFELLLVPRD